MFKIDISVIIPVYGVEKHIERYAKSIFEQSMTNGVEFIFIDDCSIDNSIPNLKKIINEYPQLKNQIQIEKLPKNMGLLGARLAGLKMAKGEYIICNDSDDWVEPTMLEEMYNKAIVENCDVVIADYFYDTKKGQTIIKQQPKSLNGLNCINQMLKDELHGSWCNKLFKRELIVNSNIIEPQKGMNMKEDLMITTQLLFHSKKIGYVNKAFYHYIYHVNSISNTISQNKLQSILYAYEFIAKFYNQNNLTDRKYREALKYFRISNLSIIAYESCLTNYKFNFGKYLKLLPYIWTHPKIDLVHQLSLTFRIIKLKPIVKLIILARTIKTKI